VAAVRETALVLRAFDFAETSQVLHLLTREEGRLHGLAKGARRLKGAFHGGLDALVLGELRVYPRRGQGLRTLAGFHVLTHFPGLRKRLARFHAAEHVRALVLGFAREEQRVEALFALTESSLRMLDVADDAQAPAIALGFEALLLRLAGFAPELSRCVRCERAARNVRTARLSPLRGGLLCRRCRGEDPGAPEITGTAMAALSALGAGPLARALNMPDDPGLRRELASALDDWTTTVLDRRLATRRAAFACDWSRDGG
jgi:DNA repair protein RecO (recombination protein O)